MNPSTPLFSWRSPLVGAMRLATLLSAVSAGCAHSVVNDNAIYDNCVIDEAARKAPICEHTSGPNSADGGCHERDLPRNMSSPLVCMTPETSPAGHALCLLCAVKPGVKVDSLLLHYRKPEVESYNSLPMHRTPNGWFSVTIPALVMSSYGLYVYYEALDGIDRVATDGESDAPTVITICEGRK